jgi:hypothetical protein
MTPFSFRTAPKTATTARPATASYRPRVEQLEDRIVRSGTGWLSSHLHDQGIRTLATYLYERDGRFSYADTLAIFNKAAHDGMVTVGELHDLRALAAHGAVLGMPPDVQDLAFKTVTANPSNVTFQDQSLPAGSVVNGALQPGLTGAALSDLIAKWFLGQDHPDLTSTGATGYQAVKGTLFGANGPQATDVQQGNIADCYFMSPLAITAQNDAATIKNMFTFEGEVGGTSVYAVRFYHDGQADYVTVDDQLPVETDRNGNAILVAAGYGDRVNDPRNVLWVSLAEKAYAQLSAESWSRQYDQAWVKDWNVNSYDSLNYGWGYHSLEEITGRTATVVTVPLSTALNSAALKQQLIADIQAGDLIVLASDNPSSGSLPDGVVSNHYYAVTGYVDGKFDLLNPYADGATYTPDGAQALELTWKQLEATFSDWEYVGPASHPVA